MLMAVVALITTMNVAAQTAPDFSYRFRVGGNLSTLTGSDDSKMKLGWTFGFGLDYTFAENCAVGLELSHDFIGAKSKNFDKNLSLEYLSFGPKFRYYVAPWLSAHAGPELGFRLRAKLDGKSHLSEYKKTELSLPVGVTFELLRDRDYSLIIDLRYRFGVTNINKKELIEDNIRNSALILTAGYRFSFSK